MLQRFPAGRTVGPEAEDDVGEARGRREATIRNARQSFVISPDHNCIMNYHNVMSSYILSEGDLTRENQVLGRTE